MEGFSLASARDRARAHTPGIARARAEQRRCADEISAGNNERGVWLGLADWFAEEVLIDSDIRL